MNRRELIKAVSTIIGCSLSGSLSSAMLTGANFVRKPSKPFFDSASRAMIAQLSERIIPTTDTPGAIAAGVPDFIEMMVADWYTEHERTIFIQGLQALNQYCQKHFDASFIATTEQQQISALQQAEQLSQSYQPPSSDALLLFSKNVDENTPFFAKLKELTVLGYYSSEIGATQELVYKPMPMTYDGDYDFAKVGRQWSY